MNFKKDSVVVVSGGEGPLGRAISQKFLSEGARMVIGWHSPQEWEEAEALIADYKSQYVAINLDVTQEESVENLMKEAKKSFGSIDILLHMPGSFSMGPLWETEAATFDKLVAVNLKGAFLCAKHAVRAMLEKKQGHIVFFPAKVAIEPRPLFGAYAVPKAGLITLTQVLREELKETDITINAFMPDAMDTWRTRRTPNAQPEKWVKTSDVANAVFAICCQECQVINGSILKMFGKL